MENDVLKVLTASVDIQFGNPGDLFDSHFEEFLLFWEKNNMRKKIANYIKHEIEIARVNQNMVVFVTVSDKVGIVCAETKIKEGKK